MDAVLAQLAADLPALACMRVCEILLVCEELGKKGSCVCRGKKVD